MSTVRMPNTTEIIGVTPDPLERIYIDSDDMNVAKYVLYANSSNALFYDSAFTKAVPATVVFNLFVKGLLVVSDGAYVTPVACTKAGALTLPTIS